MAKNSRLGIRQIPEGGRVVGLIYEIVDFDADGQCLRAKKSRQEALESPILIVLWKTAPPDVC